MAVCKILIVDDDEEIIEMLSEVIQVLDIFDETPEIDSAIDGDLGLYKLVNKPYDIVFLDYQMPGADGNEVITRIRNQEGPNQTVPIVLVSGRLTEFVYDLSDKKYEGVHLIDKPFKTETISRLIQIWALSKARAS